MARKGAKSQVAVSRTQGEIRKLLVEKWGCDSFGILENARSSTATIQFVWTDEDLRHYTAQFELPTGLEDRGMWRTMLYWLNGAIDAMDAGIIEPELVFLPWILNCDGRPLGQVLLPKLRELGAGEMHSFTAIEARSG